MTAEATTQTLYGEGTASENIVFLYDESSIIGMELTIGSTTNLYYFQRNLQGDVIAIYDTNGILKAKYLYDAWGNCTMSSETMDYTVANANPIRDHGYYYDSDTGLYCCNARYYSPKWRRFISPDDTAYLDPESVNGLNLYCYCNNDPINYVDISGHSADSIWKTLLGVAVSVGLAAVTISAIIASGGTLLVPVLVGAGLGACLNLAGQVATNLYAGKGAFEDFNWGSFALAGLTGAAFATGTGGLVGAGLIGGLSNAGMSAFEGDSWGVIAFSGIIGAASGFVGFQMGKYISNRFLNINTNLGMGDYVNMAKVDGAGFLRSSAMALISKAYTMAPTMMKSGTRAIVKITGNKVASWIEAWMKGWFRGKNTKSSMYNPVRGRSPLFSGKHTTYLHARPPYFLL